MEQELNFRSSSTHAAKYLLNVLWCDDDPEYKIFFAYYVKQYKTVAQDSS